MHKIIFITCYNNNNKIYYLFSIKIVKSALKLDEFLQITNWELKLPTHLGIQDLNSWHSRTWLTIKSEQKALENKWDLTKRLKTIKFVACLTDKGRLFHKTGAGTLNSRSAIVFFILNRGLASTYHCHSDAVDNAKPARSKPDPQEN